MTTLPLSRLLLAVTLIAACSKAEAEGSGLPPARPGGAAPTIPGPPPKPAAAATNNGPGLAAKVGQAANRFVATALPKHSAELGPKMSGTLTAVMVDEGEKVKKGQQLFRLDARTTRLGVTQAETALDGAVIARDNAQRELERQKVLAEKGTISPAVLERAEAAFNAANNGIEAAQVAVSMARRYTSDSAVTSPIDGVVARKLKSVGETVTMMPPTTVLVIQDQSVIELRARIPETTLKHVKEGELITAYFSAVDVIRPATVVRIQPTVDPQTRTIEIVADVDNSDNLLRPGMYVEVELAPPVAQINAANAAAAAAAANAPAAATADPKSPVASVKRKPAAAKETP